MTSARRAARERPRSPLERSATSEAARRLAELRTLAAEFGFPLNTVADRIALRVDEVAEATGLSTSLVRALIRDGELPAVKVRSVPLVLVADLLGFLERSRTDAQGTAQAIANELAASLAGRKQ